MRHRREFLKAMVNTTAGAYLFSHGLSVNAQGRRKRIVVGNNEIRTVDIHAHCVFREVADLISGTSMNRGFPDWYLLSPERLGPMDERGIDVAALSVNNFWWYEADTDLAQEIVTIHDEGLAEFCQSHPDRFVFLTSPALQFPELAAEQLEYAVTELGARGASIGGTVLGETNSRSKYDPFWAKAEELAAPVFMHPNNAQNLIREGGFDGRGELGNVIGNPLETSVFLTRLMFDGTLDKFPGLKVVGAHGGGYLPSYLGRTEVACEVRNNANCLSMKQPSDYLKDQILVDTMVFSAEALRHLVAEMGTEQIVYGTDIQSNSPDTLDLVLDADFLSSDEKIAIIGGNLAALLRIDT